jgi:hypothetical protein
MPNLSLSRTTPTLVHGALAAALTLASAGGCGGNSSASNGGAAGLGAIAGTSSSAGSNTGGVSNGGAAQTGGASNSAGARSGGAGGGGGSSTTNGGSSTTSGGSSTTSGGSSTTSGGSSTTSGGSTSAGGSGDCSQLTTQAECGARSDCYEISKTLLCPGSSAPCPTQFVRCSDTGCDPSCDANSVCVSQRTSGGAIITENDAGACPIGTHPTGSHGRCDNNPSYSCQPTPPACGSKIDCACAQVLCSGLCQVDSTQQIDCVEAVP